MTSNESPDARMQNDQDNGVTSDLLQTTTQSVFNSTPTDNDDQESRLQRFNGKGFVTPGDNGGISGSTPTVLSCFLCMEFTGDSNALQQHLVKNHEVKTDVLQKFMTLVTDDILPKHKTETEQPEVEYSSPVPDLPAEVQGRPGTDTTSQLSIVYDSDGLVVDLDKDREDLVDDVSVGVVNGTLSGVGKEIEADGMEQQDLTAIVESGTLPNPEPVHLEIKRASTEPSVHFCWHSGCHEFFPNAADVRLHYLDSHAGYNGGLGLEPGLEKAENVQLNYLDSHTEDIERLGLGKPANVELPYLASRTENNGGFGLGPWLEKATHVQLNYLESHTGDNEGLGLGLGKATNVQLHCLSSRAGDKEEFGLGKPADVQLHCLDVHAGDSKRSGLATVASSVTTTTELECAQCDQVFHRKEDFNKHRYCHEMNRAAECSACQRRFQSIGEFRRHMQDVHQEELTPKQQALYEASVAAASSLALLGASGLENMTAQASLKRVSPGKGRTQGGAPCPHGLESQSGTEKSDGRLDENSNSCLQAKFEGDVTAQGSGAVRDKRGSQKCEGNCGLNGMGSKCPSCRMDWVGQVNGVIPGQHRHHPMEKSRRKRSIPTKAVPCPPDADGEPSPGDPSVMDLTGRMDSISVDSETQAVPPSIAAPFTSSPAPLPHRSSASLSAAAPDRPFRCAVCKVSYSQRTQLDGHLSSQQHVSRCAKAVDSTARQALSTPAVSFAKPYSSGDQGAFADLLRQQNFPIGQFLQYGIPFMNPMMSPVMPGYTISPIGAMPPPTEAEVRVSTSSTASVTTCQRSSSDMSLTVEPVSRADSEQESSSKVAVKDDSVGGLDLVCSRCQRAFPSVELANQHLLDCSDPTTNILAPDLQSCGNRGSVGQTMMESILQKIGYECVKQFNEFRQKPRQQTTSVSAEASKGTQLDDPEARSPEKGVLSDGGNAVAHAEGVSCVGGPSENGAVYVCPTCSKRFSDIFVLKSHQEIVHMEVVPMDVLERLQQDLHAKCERVRTAGSSSEEPKAAERSRVRRQDSAVTSRNHQTVEEDDMKLKQQHQQMQLAAAYQSMQLGLMMSMGMLPQVPQRLPGPAHIAAISELFAQQQYPILDPMMLMQLQQQQNKSTTSASALAHQSQLSAAAANQKSARTRISEQQLQILRANFDINNSPTEEQIQEMSEKTGLVMKVIKHWFRNTLFKERQRNKDSPYNFNNPPATTLNLEDYEKGQALSVKLEPSMVVEDGGTMNSVPSDAGTGTGNEAPVKSKSFCSSESTVRTVGCFSESPTITDGVGQPVISGSSSSSSSQGNNAEFGSGLIRLGTGLSPMTSAIYGLSPPVNWQERRAGRTRFSNQQIQVLQEFFDRNPYPKDDEVESLSRVLGLGIRVIVVWFQNARQRVRKTEGQATSSSTSECPRSSGQYQCGNCSASFDHHLELLRHQMQDHHTTAGEAATSRAASQSDSNEVFVDDEEAASRLSPGNDGGYEAMNREGPATTSRATRVECDRCDMGFDYEEQLTAHQRTIHGVVSMLARTTQRNPWEFGNRKLSEDGTAFRQSSDDEEHRGVSGGDRRMRTTLAQDQLDYLYEKFTVESNPSRPALEEIAAHLGLKPRVVQVWFQNTRARERRGQHRVNTHKTLVKCGFCESVFRGKAALDAHVAECHASHLNVLTYPVDLAQTIHAMTSGVEPSGVPPFLAPPPLTGGPGLNPTLQSNMSYLYEKSLKQYMTKLSNLHQTPSPSSSNHPIHQAPTPSLQPSTPVSLKSDDVPLDLTTTSSGSSRNNSAIKVESEDPANRGSHYQPSLDDSYSETYSENDDAHLTGRDSTSPPLGGASNASRYHGALLTAGKRYRTQMSSLQIRVMRAIFNDYKTPSLAECESLGQQIGLPRRVVQVWFQNSRAKVKKSSFLGQEKPEGSGSTSSSSSGGVYTGVCVPQAVCGLCNVAYGVDHTMQDHLFTKRHIDRVLATVNTSEFRHSFLNSTDGRETEGGGVVTGQRKPSTSGVDYFPGNQSAAVSGVSNSLGNSDTAAGNVHRDADKTPLAERKQKRLHETSPKTEKDQQNENKKIAQNNAYPSASVGPVGNSLRQFPNVPPADLMGMMMPYFYQAGGIPAIFPGLAPIQLLQAAPNMLPGLTNTIFNPAMCGIQLSQLQIPKQAIEQIQDRLRNKSCSRAHYSEDCLSSGDLHSRLSPNELSTLSQQTIHVGFICKRCHLVFPQSSACSAHQAALCYKDADKSASDAPLKLEQLVYHCTLCRTNCSTVAEYKTHCGQEVHRRLARSDPVRGGRTAAGSNGTGRERRGSGEARAVEEVGRNGEAVSLVGVKTERTG